VPDGGADRLVPYVPTLVEDWLRDRPEQRHQELDCTLVFADVSGFTRMTELLGSRGKIGAEEMADLINATFAALLDAAYDYGAGLIKWGGDAAALLFDGPGHVLRACRGAWEMQRAMRRVGSLRTSRGPVRLRMSVGVHSGPADFFLVGGTDHRELIMTGPATTVLARMEQVAGPGQIVVSDATADALARAGERRPSTSIESGWLLSRAPHAELRPARREAIVEPGLDIGVALCRALREHIIDGGNDSEHREATIAFIKFSGVDERLAAGAADGVREALEELIGGVQADLDQHGVTFLASDLAPDGGKLILGAGIPKRLGHDLDRMIASVRAVLNRRGPLPLSAGITVGRVFVGDFGPSYRRTYSAMGDTINLAARLMAHAAPGELLGTKAVVDAASGRVPAFARPPFAAKGKRVPVTPFAIGGPGRSVGPVAPGAGPGDTAEPMVGREAELETLLELAAAAAGGAGNAVEIVGEPGLGKSRLLIEFGERASADMLWVDGDVYSATQPYAPFERLLRRRWGIADDDPAAARALRGGLEAAARTRAAHLLPWLPLIGVVAGLELPATSEVEQTEATVRKARLEELTSELLGAILYGPSILVFNDVHLMDSSSCDLIDRLARDASTRPWMVVASRRPDSPSPLRTARATRIELDPLSLAAAAELLHRATATAPLPAHRLAALAERAAGNPLFLRELVAQLAAGGSPDSLPSSVEAAIGARIDRLASADRRVLRCASVLGLDVDNSLLGEILHPAVQVRERATAQPLRLEALSEFLDPIASGRWRFNHQLVREVAYDGLPYRQRAELHARTASAIEQRAGGRPELHADLLSVHLFAGGQFEGAWRHARIAAEHARARYANQQAAESYRRALAAAAHVPDLPSTELGAVDAALGEICIELGELDAADAALRRALRRVGGDPIASARLELQVGYLRDIAGRHDVALRWVERAERSLGDLDGPEVRQIRGQLDVRRARIDYRRGRHADGQAYAAGAADLARGAGDRHTLAMALEYSDLCAVELGRPAGPAAEQALAIYEELGEVGAEARVRNTLGMLAYHRGDWPEALGQYEASEQAYGRAGTRWDAATPIANAAEIFVDQGRLDEAEAAIARAMSIWRGAGAASEVAFGESQLGRIAARRGRFVEATALLGSARDHFLAVGELTEVVVVDALLAECSLLSGEHDQALALAASALAQADTLGGAAAVPLLHRVRGAGLLALGMRLGAEESLRAALAAARRREAGHEVAFALIALLDAGFQSDADEGAGWARELDSRAARLGLLSAA
jgi:class 3 adenylate cyclase/tetratricopeptide (TPR) repeat protein